MQQPTNDSAQDRPEQLPAAETDRRRNYWHATLVLVAAVFVVRAIYLIFLSPYELLGIEAHYWEWSRRLALSYYSKGPALAWTIAAATKLLGTHEWSLRLPAAIFSALAALSLARFTRGVFGSDQAGFYAALAFCVVPGYHIFAHMAMMDSPLALFWILSCWVGWTLVQRLQTGRAPLWLWGLLGLALGAGFLVKYNILLLIPNLLLVLWLGRRKLHLDARAAGGVTLCAVAFVLAISPVLIWNAQHGWPGIGHEAGHLGVGGDAGAVRWTPRPLAFLGFLITQVLVVTVPVLTAGFRPLWPWLRRPRQWDADLRVLYLACCALPALVFFLALAFVTELEFHWPLACYATLLPLAGWYLVEGERRGAPQTRLIKRIIAVGTVCAILFWAAPFLARVPLVGRYLPVQRLMGHRAMAQRIQTIREQVNREHGQPPIIITYPFHTAGLLAFYLPDRPVVYSGTRYMGYRLTPYDYFADTDLSAPQLQGRPALLVGMTARRWQQAFALGPLTELGGDPPAFVSARYGGPRAP